MRLYAYDIISIYNLYTHICKYVYMSHLPTCLGGGMWEKSHCTVARLLLTVSHTISKSMDIFLQLAMVVCCLMHRSSSQAASANFSISGRRYLRNRFPMLSSRAFNHPTQKCDISAYITTIIL